SRAGAGGRAPVVSTSSELGPRVLMLMARRIAAARAAGIGDVTDGLRKDGRIGARSCAPCPRPPRCGPARCGRTLGLSSANVEVAVGFPGWGVVRRRGDDESRPVADAAPMRRRRGVPQTALELATRCDDGLEVVLLWDPDTTGCVWVDVRRLDGGAR